MPLTVAEARKILLNELTDFRGTAPIQKAFDKYAAAVEREIIQPVLAGSSPRTQCRETKSVQTTCRFPLRISRKVIEPFA